MQWYYSSNGTQSGPVSADELKSMITAGRVRSTDMVWQEGMQDWVTVSSVSELAVASAAPVAVAPPSIGGGALSPASPYQTPGAAQPMAQGYQTYQGAPIPTYLWQSIAVTILCCLPGGVVAIVYAAKVDGLQKSGDIAGAQAASGSAKKWCWISFGVGFVITVLSIVAQFAVIAGSSNGTQGY